MNTFRVIHTTVYSYSQPVSLCHNKAHLIPRSHRYQNCGKYNLQVTPDPAVFNSRTDFFGNVASYFTLQVPHVELSATVESDVEVWIKNYPKPSETPRWETVRDMVRADLSSRGLEALEFIFDSPHIRRAPELATYAQLSLTRGRPILEGIMDLVARIHRDFEYSPASTTVSTTIPDLMRLRRGVCQDFAHLLIGCLRSLGLPARYVSGYLRTLPPEGKPRLIGADASHAWVSAHIPGSGWLDFDPTNNCIPTGSHITLAWGRDYSDVSPIRGVILGGGTQLIHVSVDVAPLEKE